MEDVKLISIRPRDFKNQAIEIINSSPSMGCVPHQVSGLGGFLASSGILDFENPRIQEPYFSFNIAHGWMGYGIIDIDKSSIFIEDHIAIYVGPLGPMRDPATLGCFAKWTWETPEGCIAWLQNVSLVSMEQWSAFFTRNEIPPEVQIKLWGNLEGGGKFTLEY